RGVLAYCGYDIHDLARHATFEEVCYLLWHRRLPTRAELGDLQSQLIAARPVPEPVLRLMRALPGRSGGPAGGSGNMMDLLRTLTSALGHYDPDSGDESAQADSRKGPLHGGANADVMRLLLDIGKDAPPEKAEEVVRAKLARKEKIPGFGHRVYHTEDPRATHLREMSRDLGQRAGEPMWFEMSQRIEALVKAEKKLYANVDFYSASTYHALGIAID